MFLSSFFFFFFLEEKLFLEKLQADFKVFSNNSYSYFKYLSLTSNKHEFWHSHEISSHTVCLLNCEVNPNRCQCLSSGRS